MNNLSEGLEKIAKSLLNIKHADSLEDAKSHADISLQSLASMTAGDTESQRHLRKLFLKG